MIIRLLIVFCALRMCGFAPAYAGELQSAQTLQRNPSTPSQKAGALPDFYFASVYTLQEEEAVRGFFQRVADAKGSHEEATQLLREAGYAFATVDLGDTKVGCIVPPKRGRFRQIVGISQAAEGALGYAAQARRNATLRGTVF